MVDISALRSMMIALKLAKILILSHSYRHIQVTSTGTPTVSIKIFLGRSIIGLQPLSATSGHILRLPELDTLFMIDSTTVEEFTTYSNRLLSSNSITILNLALGSTTLKTSAPNLATQLPGGPLKRTYCHWTLKNAELSSHMLYRLSATILKVRRIPLRPLQVQFDTAPLLQRST